MPRMKAPPGGPVCQQLQKRYIATGRRKAVFLVSPRSTVLCFLRRVRWIVVAAWYHFGVSAAGCLPLNTESAGT